MFTGAKWPPHQVQPAAPTVYPVGTAPRAYSGTDAAQIPVHSLASLDVPGMLLPLPFMFVSPEGVTIVNGS